MNVKGNTRGSNTDVAFEVEIFQTLSGCLAAGEAEVEVCLANATISRKR
jgi:hypothetical protein